ncbi:LOW QUALITY PROTEIN: annexin A8-like [Phaethornis superciliosus]
MGIGNYGTMNRMDTSLFKQAAFLILQKSWDLTESLKSELSGNIERLMVALMYSPSKYDAREIHDTMKGVGTSEGVTIEILAFWAKVQKEIIKAYKGDKLLESLFCVVRAMSGFLTALLTAGMVLSTSTVMLNCYFPERLYHSLKGAGNCGGTLIRVIVSQSEVDLNLVKAEFKHIAELSLSSIIMDDTSGDYKTALLNLYGSD